MKTQSTFSELLQTYFIDHLMRERNVSPNTIANYRDVFRLLIGFAQRDLKKLPATLAIADLDAPFILRFLDYLEKERTNSARSRNVRLAVIHSFFKYVSLQEPAFGAIAQRVLAIQSKRYTKRPIDFLTRAEIDVLLGVPDQTTRSGRRDRTLLLLALQTGLRVSEITGLRCQDVSLGTMANVRCTGKGRKQRSIPLRKEVVKSLRAWIKERKGEPGEALFPNARGQHLSRDGVEYLLAQHVETARLKCPTLKTKRISPHVLRHSAAMSLLQSGVEYCAIALWLGHESVETVQIYIHADPEIKEKALAKTQPFKGRITRYKAPEHVMAFLKSLG